MNQQKSAVVFWKRALLINLAVISGIIFVIAAFFASPWGNPIYKTLLLVSETAPGFPIRPIKLLTKEPIKEEVKINVAGKEISADLYRPNDNNKHPAIIFTLGTLVTRKSPDVIKFSESLSRLGFVVLTPDLPDFISGLIWTDSVNTLISSFEYLEQSPYVNKSKIGYAGFCAGASVAMVAAEDPKIASEVAYIFGISPFYNSSSMVKSTILGKQKIDDELITWQPARLTTESLIIFFTNILENQNEKAIFTEQFINKQGLPKEKYETLSGEAKIIYDFIFANNTNDYDNLFALLPENLKEVLLKVSPNTNIKNFKAKLFILNDKNDTFIPRSESLSLVENLPKDQLYFKEVDSFEHVNPSTKLERWAAIRQVWHLGSYLYQIFSFNF